MRDQAVFDDFAVVPQYDTGKFPTLRPFQQTAHEALRAGAKDGHRVQMVMAPTGSGKTILGLNIIAQALQKGRKAVFVCDRTTLIDQTSAVADKYGLSAHGVMQANHWRTDASLPFQIASAQTLGRRKWPDADVIVVDEAHTQLKAWTDHVKDCRANVIGLSATPFSKGLGKIFTNLVNATTMSELTDSGVLVPMRVLSCTKINMAGALAGIDGEWADGEVERRGSEILGDVVTEWIKYGEGRKTIVFGATIKHCEDMAQQFIDCGIMAAVFTSHTTPEERLKLLKEYRKDDSMLKVLISVEALAKGFDVPEIGVIVDCRPLRKSLSTAIQMWGRGLRSSPDTGKKDCILLDHSGNIIRFLEDYTDVFFNGLAALDMGEKLDKVIRKENEEKEKSACPSCGFTPFFKRCMSCGFEAKSASNVQHEAGEMRAIDMPVMAGKKQLAENQKHLWGQVCTYARSHSAPEKQAGRAAHLFRDMTGNWPPRGWEIRSTPDTIITREVLNKIKSKSIAFAHARRAA
jgi:superfamily II DNA or RNA helicase